jgi:tRNA uridine 5-carboxymethylaminomethyl modification enzyme
MFTSRAEYRILLRQDDADQRLTPKAYEIGMATKARYDLLQEKLVLRDGLIGFMKQFSIKGKDIDAYLVSVGSSPLNQGIKLMDIISRPQVRLVDLLTVLPALNEHCAQFPVDRREEIIEAAEILIKYEGYIAREKLMAEKLKRLENIKIRGRFRYADLHTISTEGRQKLAKVDPETIAQASRISGVSPSDINVLLVLLGR